MKIGGMSNTKAITANNSNLIPGDKERRVGLFSFSIP